MAHATLFIQCILDGMYLEVGEAMVKEKVKNILDSTRADAVVGCDMGCLMNIKGYLTRHNLNVRVMHIAQLLAGQKAVRYEPRCSHKKICTKVRFVKFIM